MDLFSQTDPNSLLKDMKKLIGDKWFDLLDKNEILSIAELLNQIKERENSSSDNFYPQHDVCMRSLREIDPYDINVMIISKCPYPNDNADGIPFSCKKYHSESIKQIYFGITEDCDYIETDKYINESMNLDSWVKQGILIVNEKFRVLENNPNSLNNPKWSRFVEHILSKVHSINKRLIVCTWGSEGKSIVEKYSKKIPNKNRLHYVLINEHPIKASRSKRYWHCSHFKTINEILSSLNKDEIKWL